MSKRRNISRTGLVVLVTLVSILTAVATANVVLANHGFTDVPTGNTFHDDISWLAETGVTRGCNPPANDEFCPDDDVTRGQMAAFLRRLSEGQVVDADTARTARVAERSRRAIEAFTAEVADRADRAGVANRAEGLREVRFVETTGSDSSGFSTSHSTQCPDLFHAVGGGGFSNLSHWVLEDSRPTDDGRGWRVLYRNTTGTADFSHEATVYAVCIRVSNTDGNAISSSGTTVQEAGKQE